MHVAFPDGILWVKLGPQPDLLQRQVQIARALGDAACVFADTQQGTHLQEYRKWLRRQDRARLVVIECGAGTTIPWVRSESEWASGTLIRINPHEFQVPRNGVPFPCGALDALRAIHEILVDGETSRLPGASRGD